MKRVLLIAGGVGVVALGAVFLYPKPVDSPDAPAAAAPAEVEAPSGAAGARRGLIPERLPHEARAREGTAAEAPPAQDGAPLGGVSEIDEIEAPTALVGLEVQSMDDGLREKLGVPDDSQIGYGVVVDRIHPDSPAAEIFMKPRDVIVRANLKKVDSPEDLQKLVGDRDHTLITISRGGQLMQMVLKKPYRGK